MANAGVDRWLEREKRNWVLVRWTHSTIYRRGPGLAYVIDPERGVYPVEIKHLHRDLPWHLSNKAAIRARFGR